MANENRKPWYKDLRYWAIIATVVAAIISSSIWIPNNHPPDFSIAIDPMHGAVQQGGVITTAITIKGIQGYEYPVSLSSTGQPSGVVVTFVPPIGGPTPSYTSTVTINVDSSVPAGVYTTIIKGTGADGKEHSCNYILTVNPMPVTPTPTPTPVAAPPPTIILIIDTMDSTSGWKTYKDDKGSSINIQSILGRTDNAIEIFYDLKEWGWIGISKKINPEILSEKKGIKFFYKGSGEPNTIEFKLVYGDVGGTTFGVLWNRATVADNWVSIEVPYSHFDCWWPEDNCLRYGNKLDLKNVRKIEFAISNKPEDGDVYGSGKVIIDDIQGIMP